MFPPTRIVCLTEETVETLYLLGQQDRVVGISGYVVRPPEARREKPRVSAFTSANIDKILALKPDLVLTFSDLQADIAADLIRRGLDVHAFNQRSVAGILDMIRTLGAMLDVSEQARQLVATLETCLAEARSRAERLPKRPKVFFEEWDEPLISGIGWVSELVEIAGGIDIFADRRHQGAAKNRIVTAEEVVAREPDLIIGSWCGKKFRPARVITRLGFAQTPAVRHQDLYEIKSSLILQPGPAALTDGLAELQRIRTLGNSPLKRAAPRLFSQSPTQTSVPMRKPLSVRSLEQLGRVRLSSFFFMRDFLHSEIADLHGIPNIPDDPDLAIAAGRRLCDELLEPLQAAFGRLAIRSAYRAPAVNAFGNAHGLSCASNERNYARHIWDRRDARGCMGALATVVVPWFADRYDEGADWRAMAWWIHDHLPYSELQFFPRLAAFNIGWHERPKRRIDSFIHPRGCLTRPGMENHTGVHSQAYAFFPLPLR